MSDPNNEDNRGPHVELRSGHGQQSTDFWLWTFKIVPCKADYPHNWSLCPYVHPNEKARRRDPRLYDYEPLPCPDDKKGTSCPRGDACNYTHNIYEYWCHPKRFRTQACQLGAACNRPICFFAHSREELRQVESIPTPAEMAARSAPSTDPHKLLSLQYSADMAQLKGQGGPTPQHQPLSAYAQIASGSTSHTTSLQQHQQQHQQQPTALALQQQQQQQYAGVGNVGSGVGSVVYAQQQQAVCLTVDQSQWPACYSGAANRYIIVQSGANAQQPQQQVQGQAPTGQTTYAVQSTAAGASTNAGQQHQQFASGGGTTATAQQQNQHAIVVASARLQHEQQLLLQQAQRQQQQAVVQVGRAETAVMLQAGDMSLVSVAGGKETPGGMPVLMPFHNTGAAGRSGAAGAGNITPVEGDTVPLTQLYSPQVVVHGATMLTPFNAAGTHVDADTAQLLAFEAAGAAMTDAISSSSNMIQASQQLSMVPSGALITADSLGLPPYRTNRMTANSYSESWGAPEHNLNVALGNSSNMLPGYRLVPVATSSNSSNWMMAGGGGVAMSTPSTTLTSLGNISIGTMSAGTFNGTMGPIYAAGGSTSSNIGLASPGNYASAPVMGAVGAGSATLRAGQVSTQVQTMNAVQAALQQMSVSNDPYLHDL